MSAVDNLPPVIARIKPFAQGSPCFAEPVDNILPAVVEYRPMEPIPEARPFILVCSRDLKEEELADLQGYGKVLVFRDSYLNIPLSDLMAEHKFCYMLVNIHNKIHRQMLMKENLKEYHVVCVVGYIDAFDDFTEDIDGENTIRSLPDHQAKKADFDRLLLAQKLKKPNLLKSCLRGALKLLAGCPRE